MKKHISSEEELSALLSSEAPTVEQKVLNNVFQATILLSIFSVILSKNFTWFKWYTTPMPYILLSILGYLTKKGSLRSSLTLFVLTTIYAILRVCNHIFYLIKPSSSSLQYTLVSLVISLVIYFLLGRLFYRAYLILKRRDLNSKR